MRERRLTTRKKRKKRQLSTKEHEYYLDFCDPQDCLDEECCKPVGGAKDLPLSAEEEDGWLIRMERMPFGLSPEADENNMTFITIDWDGERRRRMVSILKALVTAIELYDIDLSKDDFFSVQWVASIGNVTVLRQIIALVSRDSTHYRNDDDTAQIRPIKPPSSRPGPYPDSTVHSFLSITLSKALNVAAFHGSVSVVVELFAMLLFPDRHSEDNPKKTGHPSSITYEIGLVNLIFAGACTGGHVRVIEALLKCFPGCASCGNKLCSRRHGRPWPPDLSVGDGHWADCFETIKFLRRRLPPLCTVTTSRIPSDPIESAASRGWAQIVRLLIGHGFDPTLNEHAALRIAAGRGHVRVVSILLQSSEAKSDLSEANGASSETATGEEAFCDLRDSRRVDPGAKDGEALVSAATGGYVEIVKVLLKTGQSRPSAKNSKAFRRASERGHEDVVALLLNYPGDSREGGRIKIGELHIEDPGRPASAPLHGILNLEESVNQVVLSEDGYGPVDPAASNNYALRMASNNGHESIVRMLLRFCPPPGYPLEDVVVTQVCPGDEGESRWPLRPRFVDPSADHDFALRHAAVRGHASVVSLLLATGRCTPNISNDLPLRSAAKNGHEQVVRCLLSYWNKNPKDSPIAIDPGAMNSEGLRQAASKGYAGVVRAFLEDARDACDPAACGNIAIKMASQNGFYEVVLLLLNDGRCNPSAERNFAVKKAIAKGHMDVVRLLLSRR
ncbi:hypothetical protein HDU67_000126 [Dinochytrium kinnereticum]|nr:hypothetical protein HDU67_000126 [Dinochytrium kinnereticum]